MTDHQQVQISYEDHVDQLPQETEELIKETFQKLLNDTGNEKKVVSLYFCSLSTIQSLNLSYRNINRPTDILSWSYQEEDAIAESEPWGELAVCLDVCQRQADASGWSLDTELLRLLVHGLGHLMGFDHEQSDEDEARMLELEKQLLSSIDLGDLYD